jgi:2-oxoglutarate ferredoxin oxidoreductase subunit gamma
MIEGREVTCFPSYGAEVRGGTANSTVIISDEMIGSPVVGNPDILVAMNEASLKRFQSKIRPNGLLIFDSSLIKSPEIRPDITAVEIPASVIAASADGKGSPHKGHSLTTAKVRSANMVMLGALIGETGILKGENVMSALERLTSSKSRKTLDENKEAIRKGIQYIADKKSKNS